MRKISDRIFTGFVSLLALAAVLILAFLIFFIVRESVPAIRDVGLKELLLTSEWRPVIYKDAPSYGMKNMILSTLYVSVLAVLIAFVIGVGCALFLACSATRKQRTLIMPYIDLLASVPSVVYGFIGLYIVVKFIENCGRAAGESVLAGGIVLAVMILPTVINISTSSIRAVQKSIKSASLALGATKIQTIFKVILPAAKSGIMTAVVLGLGRALGEAMAINMVAGGVVNLPLPFNSVRFLTTAIVSEMSYSEGLHRQVLFTIGLVLFAFILFTNMFLTRIIKKGEAE